MPTSRAIERATRAPRRRCRLPPAPTPLRPRPVSWLRLHGRCDGLLFRRIPRRRTAELRDEPPPEVGVFAEAFDGAAVLVLKILVGRELRIADDHHLALPEVAHDDH